MLQNATSLRKSPPWPPNISDEHVSCIAPATRHASLQILFTCPTPANSLKLLQNFHVFRTFSRVQNPLRLTNKTLQRRQVVRTCGALSIFTSKCASRHNDLHFFNITIPKSAPKLRCFVHFDFDMCFAPQQRALFRHLNFQKCSEPRVLCTFWLENPPTPLAAGERVRGGITSSKGQEVITSSKGKKQENKKEEARSKKQFPQARSVPQGPAVWLWRRRRFGSDS